MSAKAIDNFLRLLKKSPSGAVFNPWWQVDKENDIAPKAPRIRREQLRAYLCDRLGKSRLAIIGEALGYRGGHFSGIPMTSERLLLGRKTGIAPEHILLEITPQRTSKPQKCPDGFSEPTAWHSFNPHRGMLSNRTPTNSEQSAGIPVLKAFLDLFPCHEVVALGRIAAAQLKDLDVSARYVRHPASGGAKLFCHQVAKIMARLN